MPPKRKMDSEEDTEDVDTTTESEEDSSVSQLESTSPETNGEKIILKNDPNDEKYMVEESRPVRTPQDSLTQYEGENSTLQSQRLSNDVNPLNNNKNNREKSSSNQYTPPPPPNISQEGGEIHILRNNPNDELMPVENAHNIATPRKEDKNNKSGNNNSGVGGIILHNAPHDEAIPVSAHNSSVGTPNLHSSSSHPHQQHGMMSAREEHNENEEEETSEDDEEEESEGREVPSRGYMNPKPEAIDTEAEIPPTVIPNLEYKPQDYAKINSTANREMQELFKHILDYQPVIPELPAKLRPFIPDYVPTIGDLDPFCKIPRPDGKPDGLGIYILDEPSVAQSNPAVVLLELRATNIHSSGVMAEVVDSFEDAAHRPEVIDRWIADVKKVHYKKPLPTINYQKPMPEIESLLQVWPPEFEELLNSDLQFPPPHIDLDLDHYVRTLCCILDIPTYNSLIDSLHVMFTLYQEFRANQHFQHE